MSGPVGIQELAIQHDKLARQYRATAHRHRGKLSDAYMEAAKAHDRLTEVLAEQAGDEEEEISTSEGKSLGPLTASFIGRPASTRTK